MDEYKPITAEEARKRYLFPQEEPSENVIKFFEEVKEECKRRNTSFVFHCRTPANRESGSGYFTDLELEYLESLGYSIYWNSICLWYDVNWH